MSLSYTGGVKGEEVHYGEFRVTCQTPCGICAELSGSRKAHFERSGRSTLRLSAYQTISHGPPVSLTACLTSNTICAELSGSRKAHIERPGCSAPRLSPYQTVSHGPPVSFTARPSSADLLCCAVETLHSMLVTTVQQNLN